MIEIKYKRAESIEELEQILQLQQTNTLTTISDKERMQEGFVTVQHGFRTLNAHYAIGFKTLYSYRSNNQYWDILYLDLK